MDSVLEKARKEGYVETLFGRRRPMPDIHSSNFMVRQGAERAAINMPIQGTEADLMKMAMIEVDKLLSRSAQQLQTAAPDSRLHLVECPAEVAEHIAELLKDTMENIYKLPVRLDVDVTIGTIGANYEPQPYLNKLVRDDVPAAMAVEGQTIELQTLTGNELLQALKVKLAEEAAELLSATDNTNATERIN